MKNRINPDRNQLQLSKLISSNREKSIMWQTRKGWPFRKILLVSSLISSTTLSGFAFENAQASQKKDNSNEGWPNRRVSGGSRGCSPEQPCPPQLMALVPDGLLQTVSALPTLLFYIPRAVNSPQVPIELVILDENDRLVYEKILTNESVTGILQLRLNSSATFAGLAENKPYKWYLAVINNPRDRAHDTVVEGWIKRVPLPNAIARQVEQMSPRQQVQWYQSQKFWPEAFSKLLEIQQSSPQDSYLLSLWQQMISSLQLPPTGNESLLNNPSLVSGGLRP
jgi:hypothetical protein